MTADSTQRWNRFLEYYREYPSLELATDFSRIHWPERFFERMASEMARAFAEMKKLEAGEKANPDEGRQVGHYWLRNPEIAPAMYRQEIKEVIRAVESFSGKVHAGEIHGQNGLFQEVLLIGIGGSALGPQFVWNALRQPESDPVRLRFFDNTDPDGMDRVLSEIADLGRTLCIVISKSGGTKETANGVAEAKWAYRQKSLEFSRHAVAVTMRDSHLDTVAVGEGWLERFRIWDWVGGRTSELSAVGLLPAALQGVPIDQMLEGAAECDKLTRTEHVFENPAAMLALAWYACGNGKGERNLVVLPYKDRLELFSKYLQQLIMESLGKERDLRGDVVNQGLTVFGNKGSTDQHSFVQQLRDGTDNFIVAFIEVFEERVGELIKIEEGLTSGDYLQGFLLGTREALWEKSRQSITLSIGSINARTIGALIALFERAVGLYASLIRINAYHQPGVESGKKSAMEIVHLKKQVMNFLARNPGKQFTAVEIAEGVKPDVETIYRICRRLAWSDCTRLKVEPDADPASTRFELIER